MFRALGSVALGGLTASAGTAITGLIPPRARAYTRLTRVLYRCGGTAHTIALMKPLGAATTLSSAAASGQAVINITADSGATPPGTIAANDFVCVELDDGTFHLGKVSSVATLAITLTANLPANAAAGNKVWFFGAPGDHPVSSQVTLKPLTTLGYSIVCTASVLNDWGDPAAGILQSNNPYEPLMVHSGNGTAAGTFEYVGAAHTLN